MYANVTNPFYMSLQYNLTKIKFDHEVLNDSFSTECQAQVQGDLTACGHVAYFL